MAEKEVVLEIGVEGGGATIYRTPLSSGGWQFHVQGSCMTRDENLEEDWRSWAVEPVDSIHVALESVAKDGAWVLYYPISFHPEYADMVWELARKAAGRLPAERRALWQNCSDNCSLAVVPTKVKPGKAGAASSWMP